MKNKTRLSGGFFASGSDFPARDIRALREELAITDDSDLEAWIVEMKQ